MGAEWRASRMPPVAAGAYGVMTSFRAGALPARAEESSDGRWLVHQAPYLTVSVPFIPAAACPGTVQR